MNAAKLEPTRAAPELFFERFDWGRRRPCRKTMIECNMRPMILRSRPFTLVLIPLGLASFVAIHPGCSDDKENPPITSVDGSSADAAQSDSGSDAASQACRATPAATGDVGALADLGGAITSQQGGT